MTQSLELPLTDQLAQLQNLLAEKDFKEASSLADHITLTYTEKEHAELFVEYRFDEVSQQIYAGHWQAQYRSNMEKCKKELNIPLVKNAVKYLETCKEAMDQLQKLGVNTKKYRKEIAKTRQQIKKLMEPSRPLDLPKLNNKKLKKANNNDGKLPKAEEIDQTHSIEMLEEAIEEKTQNIKHNYEEPTIVKQENIESMNKADENYISEPQFVQEFTEFNNNPATSKTQIHRASDTAQFSKSISHEISPETITPPETLLIPPLPITPTTPTKPKTPTRLPDLVPPSSMAIEKDFTTSFNKESADNGAIMPNPIAIEPDDEILNLDSVITNPQEDQKPSDPTVKWLDSEYDVKFFNKTKATLTDLFQKEYYEPIIIKPNTRQLREFVRSFDLMFYKLHKTPERVGIISLVAIKIGALNGILDISDRIHYRFTPTGSQVLSHEDQSTIKKTFFLNPFSNMDYLNGMITSYGKKGKNTLRDAKHTYPLGRQIIHDLFNKIFPRAKVNSSNLSVTVGRHRYYVDAHGIVITKKNFSSNPTQKVFPNHFRIAKLEDIALFLTTQDEKYETYFKVRNETITQFERPKQNEKYYRGQIRLSKVILGTIVATFLLSLLLPGLVNIWENIALVSICTFGVSWIVLQGRYRVHLTRYLNWDFHNLSKWEIKSILTKVKPQMRSDIAREFNLKKEAIKANKPNKTSVKEPLGEKSGPKTKVHNKKANSITKPILKPKKQPKIKPRKQPESKSKRKAKKKIKNLSNTDKRADEIEEKTPESKSFNERSDLDWKHSQITNFLD
jgi:hypothetical protein